MAGAAGAEAATALGSSAVNSALLYIAELIRSAVDAATATYCEGRTRGTGRRGELLQQPQLREPCSALLHGL